MLAIGAGTNLQIGGRRTPIIKVIDQPNDDIPVFRVQREGARSKTRIHHRIFLLLFIGLPTYDEDE